MSYLNEVREAIKVLVKGGTDLKNIYILHCNTEYPTLMKDVNLNVLNTLKRKITDNIGYSDHTIGSEVSIAAVAMGCKVIEKHITLDINMSGPDHKSSMEPEDFFEFVKKLKNIKIAMGSSLKKPSKSEFKNIKKIRKSIYACKMILKGELLTKNNITAKRPFVLISPMKIKDLYGKKAKQKYNIDDLIKI